MPEPAVEERLSRFPVFEGFSAEELRRVRSFVAEKGYARGSTLFRQGDVPDSFYLVDSGAVQEIGTDPTGAEAIRRTAEARDWLGHRALMDNKPRQSTAEVVQDALLFVIDGDGFRTMLAMFPKLRERLGRTGVVSRLLAVPLFGCFPEERLHRIADLVRIVEYPARQVIFRRGEPSDAFYVIDTGQVMEQAASTVPGGTALPQYLCAGSFFGHHGLLHGTDRESSAAAATDVRLFRFSVDSVRWLQGLCPEFEHALRRPDIVRHLSQTMIFSRLGEEELRHLAGFVGLAHLRPGSVLYRQGEVDRTFYLLYDGEAIVRGRDAEGRERPKGYFEAGDTLGETSLFLEEPRDVTVEAITSTNWLYLTQADLEQFLAQHPDLRERMVPREEVKSRVGLSPLSWMEPGEQLVLLRRRHWFILTVRLVWPGLLLMLALVVLSRSSLRTVGYLLLAASLAWVLWRVIDWLNDYYAVTTRRVAHRERVLLIRETRDETPLDKVQNINLARGLIGNLLGFGTLLIDTAATIGASRVVFTYVADPQEVQATIFEQVSRAHAGERVEMHRLIRDRLEESLGAGLRPLIPRPAIPSTAAPPPLPPPPSLPGPWRQIGDATWRRWFWITKTADDRVTWRKHWIRLLLRIWPPSLVVSLLALALALYVVAFEGPSPWFILGWFFVLLVVLFWLWWNWENWGNDLYIVTNDRIIDIEALPLGFRTRRTEATFDRVQNVNFEIPNPIATILRYGTVFIYTAGVVGRLDFTYVPNPKAVQAEIFRRLAAYEAERRREQRDEQRAELPQWFAIYEETRRP